MQKTDHSLKYVQIGHLERSKSGRSVIVLVGGNSGICKMQEVKMLVEGVLRRIPVKAQKWVKRGQGIEAKT